MTLGLYLRELTTWQEIPDNIKRQFDWVIYGDYGCFDILSTTAEILEFHDVLGRENKKLHYLSPKVTEAVIDREMERVTALLAEKIHVSINDWGLLYQLRPYIEMDHHLYIGRLLTKSIADWAWAPIFLAKEEPQAVDYLVQSNFQHRLKIDFFKQWGIKGVEVSINQGSEPSFAHIQAQGLAVVGYADHSILALSRVCPLARLKGVNLSNHKCGRFCKTSFRVIPTKEVQQEIYPEMELWGNMVCRPLYTKLHWNNYQKVVYRWTPTLESRLRKDNIMP